MSLSGPSRRLDSNQRPMDSTPAVEPGSFGAEGSAPVIRGQGGWVHRASAMSMDSAPAVDAGLIPGADEGWVRVFRGFRATNARSVRRARDPTILPPTIGRVVFKADEGLARGFLALCQLSYDGLRRRRDSNPQPPPKGWTPTGSRPYS